MHLFTNNVATKSNVYFLGHVRFRTNLCCICLRVVSFSVNCKASQFNDERKALTHH